MIPTMLTNGSLTVVSKFYWLLITLITAQHGNASPLAASANHTYHHVHTISCKLCAQLCSHCLLALPIHTIYIHVHTMYTHMCTPFAHKILPTMCIVHTICCTPYIPTCALYTTQCPPPGKVCTAIRNQQRISSAQNSMSKE